jgi:hypothetical protein
MSDPAGMNTRELVARGGTTSSEPVGGGGGGAVGTTESAILHFGMTTTDGCSLSVSKNTASANF